MEKIKFFMVAFEALLTCLKLALMLLDFHKPSAGQNTLNWKIRDGKAHIEITYDRPHKTK